MACDGRWPPEGVQRWEQDTIDLKFIRDAAVGDLSSLRTKPSEHTFWRPRGGSGCPGANETRYMIRSA